ncbi:TolC family protein [Pedobacter sp.]|uniref:TolC family protein n=1 Tax=Pedobacter sp. TaxID=1411316 RepID=UPI003D7F65EC
MKNIIITLLGILFGTISSLSAQEQHLLLKVDSLLSLAAQNSKQLEITRHKINISANATTIEKQRAYLPELGASFSYGYISNAQVWDNHFNYETTIMMPHTSLDLSLSAGYVVFNGNAAKNKIARAKLEEQISLLDYQKDKEDIQFLLLAKYLDLFASRNQEHVYLQNIALADKRLANIKKLIEQGMLTHNDLVRSQLQLTDIKQQLNEVRNNITIINHDLKTVLALPENIAIDVDTLLYNKAIAPGPLNQYTMRLRDKIPELKIANVQNQLAVNQVDITKADRLPSISLFAGDALSRPFLYSIPPQDIYLHHLQVGFRIRYDISSLYKSKNLIQQARMNAVLSQKSEEWANQQVEMAIHAAYVKLQNAWEQYASKKESFQLAQDNYRVVEQKYLNKFATITDMLDASTALLTAQINMNNARIGIVYQHYNLLKTSGLWEEVRN